LPATNELSVAMPLRCVCTGGDGIAWEQEAVKVLEAQGWRWRLVYLALYSCGKSTEAQDGGGNVE